MSKKYASKPEIFTNHFLFQYPTYLDDLEILHDLSINHPDYKPCHINNCQITYDKNGNICNIHGQIWDSTHFYVVKLFQLRLRDRTIVAVYHGNDKVEN